MLSPCMGIEKLLCEESIRRWATEASGTSALRGSQVEANKVIWVVWIATGGNNVIVSPEATAPLARQVR